MNVPDLTTASPNAVGLCVALVVTVLVVANWCSAPPTHKFGESLAPHLATPPSTTKRRMNTLTEPPRRTEKPPRQTGAFPRPAPVLPRNLQVDTFLESSETEGFYSDFYSEPPPSPDSDGFRAPLPIRHRNVQGDNGSRRRRISRRCKRQLQTNSPRRIVRTHSPARSDMSAADLSRPPVYVPTFESRRKRKKKKIEAFPQASLRVCPTPSEFPSAFDVQTESKPKTSKYNHPALEAGFRKRPLRSLCGGSMSSNFVKKKKARKGTRSRAPEISDTSQGSDDTLPAKGRLLRYRKRPIKSMEAGRTSPHGRISRQTKRWRKSKTSIVTTARSLPRSKSLTGVRKLVTLPTVKTTKHAIPTARLGAGELQSPPQTTPATKKSN